MIPSTRPLAPRRRAAALALLVMAAAAMSLAAAPRHAASRAVEIKGFKFHPDSIRLAAGDTVVWSNGDDEPHTITMDTSTFDSGDIAPGSRFRWVFRHKGRFRYHCEVHEKMHGVLDVR